MLAAHGLLIGALLAASLLLSSVPCTAAFAPPIALSSISARHSATSLAERAGRQGGRGSSLLALGMKRDGEEEEASLPLKVTW
ncbi:hypothetical protein T484DRAFT_1765887 [Baffinella frigidus]|nr:hypothetical protein T484DRAFT_1765887 [Cryptophyta sp. CCMP2293]